MCDLSFYDPFFYDLKVGPGGRVASIYLSEAKSGGGPVLELGCGTGDVLLPIAREKISVVGVDASSPMLSRFRERVDSEPADVQALVTIHEERMEDFVITERVRQVFIPNDGIAHLLDLDVLRRTFELCREHLLPDGCLVLDVTPFDVVFLARFVGDDREVLRFCGRYEIGDEARVQVWERTAFDPESGSVTADFRYEFADATGQITRVIDKTLVQHPRRLDEITLALENAGFEAISTTPHHEAGRLERFLVRARPGLQ